MYQEVCCTKKDVKWDKQYFNYDSSKFENGRKFTNN